MKLSVTLLLLFMSSFMYSQNFTINGFVKDATTGEALLFANCSDTKNEKSTIANNTGFYSITLPKGEVYFVVSYVGYKSYKKKFYLKKDTNLIIELEPKPNEIEEVTVNSYSSVRQQVIMGKTTVPVKTIETIPSFVGDPDLMKAVSFLPGVVNGREGYSNIYVRGGDRGQNLILLDGIKLYNTNHVGGFLSLFNSDIIKHVDIYKGGFPSRYGGRASSVIDIYTKDGNIRKLKGKFSVGLLISSLMVETPISEKVNCFVSLRSSYYDLFTISARNEYKRTGTGEYVGYTFFDFNSKINFNVSRKQKLSLSIFSGHDYQKNVEANNYSEQSKDEINKLSIHNTGISLSSRTVLNSKMFWRNTLAFSTYSNESLNTNTETNYGSTTISELSSFSKINDISLRSDLDIYLDNINSIKTGIEISKYNFVPAYNHLILKIKMLRVLLIRLLDFLPI